MYQTYETLLGIAKKSFGFWGYLKDLSFRNIEKRQNTSSESPLSPMCSDKYPYKYLSINIAKRIKNIFSVFHLKILSFKGISCSI